MTHKTIFNIAFIAIIIALTLMCIAIVVKSIYLIGIGEVIAISAYIVMFITRKRNP